MDSKQLNIVVHVGGGRGHDGTHCGDGRGSAWRHGHGQRGEGVLAQGSGMARCCPAPQAPPEPWLPATGPFQNGVTELLDRVCADGCGWV